ncbi:MAG: hypothetical protein ACXWA3_01260 [Acidimicrobiales bacterium]
MTEDPNQWEPVERTDRKPQLGHGARATLVVTLSRRPEAEWLQHFGSTDIPKQGSATFLAAKPQIDTAGTHVSLAIEDDDLEAAARWIDALIDEANQDYLGRVIPAQRAVAEGKQAAQDALDQRRLDLQRRLDELDQKVDAGQNS